MNPSVDQATEFENHRAALMALAYRMTGSVADAEDIVQEAFIRWQRTDPSLVRYPRAYLSRTVTRLSVDSLKSARAKRESYVGPWLPEPVVGDGAMSAETAAALADDVSMALMMALERLSPSERAAFLLHDVFDSSYAEIAAALDRSEAACRKLVSRARTRIRDSRPNRAPSVEEHARVVRAFGAAALTGDIGALEALLTDDAVLYPDGGGKVVSALRPIRGSNRVARFIFGVQRKFPLSDSATLVERLVNGAPGFCVEEDGRTTQTMSFEVLDGRVAAVYVVRNPDKLSRLVVS